MKKKETSIKHFIWAIKYVFKKGKFKSFLFILLSTLSVIEIWLSLLFTETITNTFFATGQNELIENIIKLCTFFLVIIFTRILLLLKTNLWETIYAKLQSNFSMHYYEKTTKITWEHFENYDKSNIMYIVKSNGISSIVQCFQSLVTFINSLLLILVYCFFLSRINFFLAFGYLIIVIIFNLYSKKVILDMGEDWSQINVLEKKQQYFRNVCGGKNLHTEYVLNDLYGYFYDKWNIVFNQEQNKKISTYGKGEILNRISRIILYAPYILMMFFVSFQIAEGKYEVGFLILCMDMFNEIINTVTTTKDQYAKAILSSNYIKKFLEFEKFEEKEKNQYEQDDECAIAISNASYKYPQSKEFAIKDISLIVKHGEKIAILGENGSGKTTLINIICGLLKLEQGDAYIHSKTNGNSNIISVIYQDFIHYQLSVRENIEFGSINKRIDDERIWELLELVGLKNIVSKFEEGLDTKLGQLYEGLDLSKGQWQRLAIARLLANEEAQIWILDEPTSYLDPSAEADIYQLVNSLSGDRTVLYISHRLGFSRNADKILIMEKGKIIESGNHQELLDLKGNYSKIYLQQIKYIVG